MAIIGRSSSYKVVVQVTPTKQISKSFRLKRDAEIWESEQKQFLRQGKIVAGAVATVKEFSATWLDDVKGRRSIATYERYEGILRNLIIPRFGRSKLNELEPYAVELWQQELARRYHPKTCNNILLVLKKMLNDAVHWRKLGFNPLAGVRALDEPEQDFAFLTRDELSTMLGYVREINSEAFAIFATASLTGMRLAEIQGLKWDCVNFALDQITVKRIWDSKAGCLKETTKTKSIRVIPMAKDLKDILVAKSQGKDFNDLVFLKGFEGFNFHQAAAVCKRYCREAGVKEITFHQLRHSFASNFMMAGGNLFDLQKILGHTDIQMTQRYSHLSPGHLKGKTEILNYGLGKTSKVIELRKAHEIGNLA